MFRNVRTEPRRFAFRSRHLPELDAKWMERKEQIDTELTERAPADEVPARPIRFQSTHRRSSGASTDSAAADWKDGRKHQILGARYAMLRAALIAMGLVWLAWKGIQWVEMSDFSGVLKWMENA